MPSMEGPLHVVGATYETPAALTFIHRMNEVSGHILHRLSGPEGYQPTFDPSSGDSVLEQWQGRKHNDPQPNIENYTL